MKPLLAAALILTLLASGCVQQNTGDQTFSLQHDGMTRTYLVHIPTGYTGENPAPLVISLHGGGGIGALLSKHMGGMSQKSDEEGFIAVYPDGVSSIGTPGIRQHWSSGSMRTEVRSEGIDDVGFISSLIDDLSSRYNIDTKRVYATGISNGAQMSYRLACELSDRIVAIAPVGSGLVVENCSPSRPVSIIHFHGTIEPGWPYYGGEGCFTNDTFEPISATIDKWLELDDCSSPPETTYQNGDSTCETYPCNDSELVFCTIEGGGHTWPGGFAYPLERTIEWDEDCILGEGEGVGKVSQDISAIDEMWSFFEKHPMP
jgi:polyhydroxybutyrate depolymerase